MANVSYNTPFNVGSQGAVYPGGGGGGGVLLVGGRSILDARRMMNTGKLPQAQYPDGYLGTIIDRRQDKLMTAVQGRLTERQYQRGVHKGERIDIKDYAWTEDLNLMSGLENEKKGLRWTVRGNPVERLAHQGDAVSLTPREMWKLNKVYFPENVNALGSMTPRRTAQLANMRPAWR